MSRPNPTKPTTPKDRVNQAIAFQKPDRTPRDFAAVPEVWAKLAAHFGTPDRHQILKHLGVDCRIVSYDSFCRPPAVEPATVDVEASRERSSTGGMWRKTEPDGSNRDIWGAHRARLADAFGELDQRVSFPLASAQSLDDLRHHPWPQPGWRHFTGFRGAIQALNAAAAHPLSRDRTPTPPAPKPSKNQQNLPFDTLLPVWQDAPVMSAGEGQFSLARVAAITGDTAKKVNSYQPVHPQSHENVPAIRH